MLIQNMTLLPHAAELKNTRIKTAVTTLFIILSNDHCQLALLNTP